MSANEVVRAQDDPWEESMAADATKISEKSTWTKGIYSTLEYMRWSRESDCRPRRDYSL